MGLWVELTWKDKRLRVLAPIHSTSIEKNISLEKMNHCFEVKKKEMKELHEVLLPYAQNLKVVDVFKLMLCLFNLFGQFASYEDNKTLVLAFSHEEYDMLRHDFKDTVTETVSVLFRQTI